MVGKSMKKRLAGLLSIVLAVSAVASMASCGKGEQNPKDTSAVGSVTEEEGTQSAYSTLEKQQYNQTFTILCRSELKDDFDIQNYGGSENDLLDDMIYERNKVVESDYGITIACEIPGDYTAVNEKIRSQATSGLDDYDMVIGHKYTFTGCAQSNYLLDLASVDVLNLSDSWWDAGCRENLTVDGKTFLMTGDVLPSSMKISACLVFNKKMMKDLGKEEPYDLVKEGGWTLDALLSMTADVTKDKDGDGKINYKNDTFGMTAWKMDAPYSMFYGAGGMFVTIDETGMPVLDFDSEKVINIYDKLYTTLISQEAYMVTEIGDYETNYDVFAEGRALFCDTTLSKITSFLSSMSEDYGILPEAKYDQYQQEYLSFVNGASGFVGMVSSEQSVDFAATIMNAMGAYNYDKVTPNMFEIITKLKGSRDPQSVEMVDIILRSRVYDFAYFFDLSVANVVQEQLSGKKPDISSTLTSAIKNSNSSLNKIIKTFNKQS